MNITEAKTEIKNTIKAYLKKDEFENYVIPLKSQRPILLMGAPGIGKTALMEQIAREMNLNLVSYSITHHTRQSALGLPYIVEKEGYSATNYTMSEIIAEIYDSIKKTGLQEGILFLDEINCVSETLAPALLRFLQYKSFGTHAMPKGFVVIAAGNPPEYNRSVREFDIVTLDRMKKLEIEPSLDAWLNYAYNMEVHGSIISYLNLKKDNFYKIEATVDGIMIATARGWEDLSHIIKAYETEDIPLSYEEVRAYIQNTDIAKDFLIYYELYKKYENDYRIGEVLKGNVDSGSARRLGYGAFDEKISIIGLLNSGLGGYFSNYGFYDDYVTDLYEALKRLKVILTKEDFKTALNEVIAERKDIYEIKKKAELLSQKDEKLTLKVLNTLTDYRAFSGFEEVRESFSEERAKREQAAAAAETALNSAFKFIDIAFGKAQETVLFITALNMDKNVCRFLEEIPNETYIKLNRELLFEEKEKAIRKEIAELG
ncbi:MAG: MoxR family ATPase [Clostridiales bacterium]|nr:MoxR family ATPase [Clostridiales bacterium]